MSDRPSPGGALVLLDRARGAQPGALRAALDPQAGEWAEGPLALALASGHARGLHVGARIVCALEGALYALAGSAVDAPPPDAPAAARWLAAAYEHTGAALLPRLRGEFWALLWDRALCTGIVVCDHLGVRAPYWTAGGGRLLCGSDLPELLRAVERRPGPDAVVLAHWLMMTLPAEGATFYEGVRRLPAGHVLELGPGGPRARRYWTPVYREPQHASFAAGAAQVRGALDVAVTRRLGGTSPGVLLSGGLDSSAVAALATRAGARPATYTAVFPGHLEADESALVDLTVAELKLASTRIVVGEPAVLAGALMYLRAWQVPPSSPNLFFWLPLLERAALDGTGVMLDGEGGDELFGFSPYLLADRLRQARALSALRLAARWPGSRGRPSAAALADRLYAYGVRAALPPGVHAGMRQLRGLRAYAPAWLPAPLARRWLESEDASMAWKRLDGPRWWAHLVDATTRGRGPSVVFEQCRRRCAQAGLESRHPLVDVDVLELVLGLDPELSFDRRFGRPLLRAAVAGVLPDEVRLRPRKSFLDSVFSSALAGREQPALRALLEPGQAELGAFVDVDVLHRELFGARPRQDSQGWVLTAWRAATAELWLRQERGARLPPVLDEEIPSPRFDARVAVGS